MEEKVLQIINKHKNKDSKLLAILHDVQDEFGYITEDAIKTIAKELGMEKGEVYDAASFYSFFRFKPEGKHEVMICDCIVCHIKGSGKIIERIEKEFGVKMGETTEDRKFTFKVVEGLGHCESSPVMMLDGKIYGNLTPDKVVEILRGCQ